MREENGAREENYAREENGAEPEKQPLLNFTPTRRFLLLRACRRAACRRANVSVNFDYQLGATGTGGSYYYVRHFMKRI